MLCVCVCVCVCLLVPDGDQCYYGCFEINVCGKYLFTASINFSPKLDTALVKCYPFSSS